MRKGFKKTAIRRVVSSCLAAAFVLTSTVTDVDMFNGMIHIDLSANVEAASGNIDDAQPLDASVIPDSNLLAYLKSEVSAAGGSATVKDLALKVTGDLKIPSNVSNVTGLGWARGARSIDMSAATVVSINDSEFSECAMTSVKLPKGIEKIGEAAFADCTNLTSVSGLSSVKEIGSRAFNNCQVLNDTSVSALPTTLTSMGDAVFQGCKAITEVKIPKIATGNNAGIVPLRTFANCGSLRHVTFCDNVAQIQNNAFEGTGALSFAINGSSTYGNKLPSTVNYIGESAFVNSKIPSIDLSGNTIKVIQKTTFYKADLSKGFTFPQGVTAILDEAFRESNVVDINMPKTITTLGESAFYCCGAMKTLKISENITVISKNAFMGIGSAGVIIGNIVYYNEGAISGHVDVSYTGESKLTELGVNAFSCASVGSKGDAFISELKNLKIIGAEALSATDFVKLTIPACVETLGEGAISRCWNLEEAVFANGSKVTEIPAKCFGGDKAPIAKDKSTLIFSSIALKKVVLPKTVKTIGEHAFSHCYALHIVNATGSDEEGVILPEGLESIQAFAFDQASSFNDNYSKTTQEMIAAGCKESKFYRTVGYKTYIENGGITKVVVPDSCKEIGASAFANNKTLESIKLGSGVTEIPEKMCEKCGAYSEMPEQNRRQTETDAYNKDTDKYTPLKFVGLKKAEWSNNVKKIGASAFADCYALESQGVSWNLSDNLEVIGNMAFMNCKSLSNVVFSSKLTTIGQQAFAKCSQFYTNSYHKGVKVDGNTYTITDVFAGLSRVDFTFATKLEKIGTNAFELTNLSSFMLKGVVTEVPANICNQCTNLETVVLPGTVTKVSGNAFKDCYELDSIQVPFSAELDKTALSGYTAANNSRLTVSSTKTTSETATVIKDREITLSLNLFKNFTAVNLSVVDSNKDVNDATANLINNDSNDFVKVTGSGSTVTMVGKQYGETKLKLGGIVNLYSGGGQNYNNIILTIAQPYDIQITDKPVKSMEIKESSNRIVEENGQKVLYMPYGSTSKYTITSKYLPGDPTGQITFSVENPSIAKVNEEAPKMSNSTQEDKPGTVVTTIEAGEPGDTYLHIKGGEVDEKVLLKVRIPVSSVNFEFLGSKNSSATVATGTSYPLTMNLSYDKKYEAYSASYAEPYKVEIDKPEVATIDANGNITALSEGTARINFKFSASQRTSSFSITVKNGYIAPAQTVEISENSAQVYVGKTKTLTSKVLPGHANQAVTWTSSDPKIATVFGGVVKGIKAGSVTIKVTTESGRSASCSLTVKSPSKGLKIRTTAGNSSKAYIVKGASLNLSKYVTNADCTDSYKFTCPKNKYGTVTESGYVTTKKKTGSFTVTLTAYNTNLESKLVKTASTKIKIYVVKKAIKTKKVSISGKKSMKVGAKMSLLAKPKTKKFTGTFTWKSSNSAVATVDSFGVVTANKKGKTKITVTTSNNKKKTFTLSVK